MRDLLLLLSRYPFEEKNRDTLSELLGEVTDWPELVKLINAHGIIALATYNIKEAGLVKKVPREAMSVLENGYMQSVVRNTWLAERWKEVNSILTSAGIKHVLLKGMALEHTLYGSKGLRQMNDNDILLKKEEALIAWNLLNRNGFKQDLMKSPLHRKVLFDTGKHLPCLYKNGYAIEIHHKLLVSNIDYDNRWGDPIDDAVEISVYGTRAWILNEELQIKYLTEHFVSHKEGGGVQIRQYADIILLDSTNKITMPDTFIINPQQENEAKFRKAAYKINIKSIPAKYRLPYLIGDIFPSLKWMKRRYGCSGGRAILYYPHRLGKLVWLI